MLPYRLAGTSVRYARLAVELSMPPSMPLFLLFLTRAAAATMAGEHFSGGDDAGMGSAVSAGRWTHGNVFRACAERRRRVASRPPCLAR